MKLNGGLCTKNKHFGNDFIVLIGTNVIHKQQQKKELKSYLESLIPKEKLRALFLTFFLFLFCISNFLIRIANCDFMQIVLLAAGNNGTATVSFVITPG